MERLKTTAHLRPAAAGRMKPTTHEAPRTSPPELGAAIAAVRQASEQADWVSAGRPSVCPPGPVEIWRRAVYSLKRAERLENTVQLNLLNQTEVESQMELASYVAPVVSGSL